MTGQGWRPQLRGNRELWLALFAVIVITGFYLFMMIFLAGVPAASGFYGHMMGVLGFLLMLMTETLYSVRKRSRQARWGRMSEWLNFHIFTGLVGPYLVLLHSSWKFNGLAGVTMLFTVVIVVSGFIGRYIYTAVPRTADGIVMEADQLNQLIHSIQAQLQDPAQPAHSRQLKKLTRRHKRLQRQLASMANARRALALWHTIHIPIGMVLFASAFIHILGALYYATLLH